MGRGGKRSGEVAAAPPPRRSAHSFQPVIPTKGRNLILMPLPIPLTARYYKKPKRGNGIDGMGNAVSYSNS